MNPDSEDRNEISRHNLSQQERAVTAIVLCVIAAVGFALYIANTRYHIRPQQLIEFTLYLICLIGAGWLTLYHLLTYRKKLGKTWPRLPAYIPPHKDQANVQKAFNQSAILLGYEHKEPCLWADEVRRMQAILLGAPGSGKTTVLRNIIVQDVHRAIGNSSNPNRIPLIIFDGKGDGEFLKSLLFEIALQAACTSCACLIPRVQTSPRGITRSTCGRVIPTANAPA